MGRIRTSFSFIKCLWQSACLMLWTTRWQEVMQKEEEQQINQYNRYWLPIWQCFYNTWVEKNKNRSASPVKNSWQLTRKLHTKKKIYFHSNKASKDPAWNQIGVWTCCCINTPVRLEPRRHTPTYIVRFQLQTSFILRSSHTPNKRHRSLQGSENYWTIVPHVTFFMRWT